MSQRWYNRFNLLLFVLAVLACSAFAERQASVATTPSGTAYVSSRAPDDLKDAKPRHRVASFQTYVVIGKRQSRPGLAPARFVLIALPHTPAAPQPSYILGRVLFSDWTARAPPSSPTLETH